MLLGLMIEEVSCVSDLL